MKILWIALAFIAAVLVATILGSIVHTQFVLAGLTGLGVAIPFSTRLSMTAQDIAGMGPSLGGIIAIGFIVAMSAAALVYRFAGTQRNLVYTVAGAVAVGVALTVMGMVYDITPIAGARSIAGFVTMMLAGALGGLTFARVSRT